MIIFLQSYCEVDRFGPLDNQSSALGHYAIVGGNTLQSQVEFCVIDQGVCELLWLKTIMKSKSKIRFRRAMIRDEVRNKINNIKREF